MTTANKTRQSQVMNTGRARRIPAALLSALRFRSIICWLMTLTLVWNSAALPVAEAANNERGGKVSSRSSLQSSSPVEAVTVRRGPRITGRVEGSLRQLNGESLRIESDGEVTGDLFVPGTPTVDLNGNASIGSTAQGAGSAEPSGYTIRLSGSARVARLVTRTDPIAMPAVNPPPAPAGTRDVTITQSSQSAGDFATLRDLTLSGNAGAVAVPPGTYRRFKASGQSASFIFGVAGATTPAVYNLQDLDLQGSTALTLAGPVTLTIGDKLDLSGSAQMGSASDVFLLTVNVAAGNVAGNVQLSGNSKIHALLRAPSSRASLDGHSQLIGRLYCDDLELRGDGLVRGMAESQPPPTLDSVAPTSGVQGQTLNVTLRGLNTHWVNGQTRASFGGEVSVGGAAYGELGVVQVTDATTATAQITISPSAALAPRTAQVVTPITGGNETVSLTDVFVVNAATPPGAASAMVSVYAGEGIAGFVDGTATVARFRDLTGVAASANDVVYVADAGNHAIRRVANDGAVVTFAGNGVAGFADGAPASARFNNPQGVTVDANGIVYVADTNNHRIRRIDPDGNVATLAGDGNAGFVNGPGATARFNAPRGVAIDHLGNVYVADTGNSSVRVINSAGQVQTVAGDGSIGDSDSPTPRFNGLAGIAFDGGRLYVYIADSGNHRIRQLIPGGAVVTTLAGASRGFADGTATQARFAEPAGIAPDGSGRLIVADAINSLIRSVHPEKAQSGEAGAVTTIAGTGARGLADGAGDVAKFFTPRGVVALSSSAIIVADTGNHALRKILLPPVIASFSPTRALVGTAVTINGERFDASALNRNTVKFARAASAGGGQTTATVTFATRTQLTVVVPSDAATGPITVTTEGGVAASATNFEVLQPPPVITAFSPQQGFVGDTVTLTGTNLKLGGDTPAVTFAGLSGSRIPALVTFSSPTETRVTVPNGAITGAIELTTQAGRVATPGNFIVDTRQDYFISVSPTNITTVRGGTGVGIVHLNSGQNTFTQLATLTATGLPSGVTANFEPAQITAGAQSTLRLAVSSALAAGSYPFTVQASALADGVPLNRTAQATLDVQAGGQTTLSGRVLSTGKEPIIGATVSLDGKTATTDAAGAFLLSGVNAGTNRPVMVDGRTASAPNRTYPVIVEPADIVAGQANTVPYIFYLPAIDTQHEVQLIPNQNTVVTTPSVPGLSMTIPAGANLRNRDGSPVTRVSITPVPIDRTPAPLPTSVGIPLVFTSQPGGAIADIEMPVVYPNLSGIDPGVRMELWAFNHDTVQWYVYGYGRVSNDGRTIQPEINPATGRLYGLRDFSWHGPNAGQGGNEGGEGDCPPNNGGSPVNYSTGIKEEAATDVSFGGARGGIVLTRVHTSDLAQNCDDCPFGRGWSHSYAVRLDGAFASGGAGRAVRPNESTGRLFSYSGTDGGGALTFSSQATVRQLGDTVRKLPDGSLEYRYAHGQVMRFNSSGRLTAVVDRNGNTTTLSYTGANLTQITDAVGRSITLEYSGPRITKVTDPLGRIWRYGYGGVGGHLTSVTDPLDNVTRYSYSLNRLTQVIDARGTLAKQITYDGAGRVIKQQFADGGVETYAYTLSGTIVTGMTMTDALGRTMSKRFDARGYVLEETDAFGQTTTFIRAADTSQTLSRSGPCGCSEGTRTYDERGNLTSATNRLGQTVRFEYDPVFNQITKITDQLGRVTLFAYDARGNLSTTTNALNQAITFAYDQFGLMTSMTDPLSHARRMEYDAQGNLIASIDALNHRTTYEYDSIGRTTAVIDALGRRAGFTYDALDRLLTVTDPAGAVTSYNYDANDNVISATDAINRVWRWEYDVKDRPVSATDPLGRVDRFEYNLDDEITKAITSSGRAFRYEYDARGQQTASIDPLGQSVRFAYDNRGRLTTLTDERGNITTFQRDELYRVIGVRDPLGRPATIRYDAVGNIESTTDRLGRIVGFQYDALSRLERATYADATVAIQYDAAGRPTRIDDSQSDFVAWTYDDADRLLSETTPQGVVNYAYNQADQRVSMAAANRPLVTYGYDAVGRLSTITQGAETYTYGYDALSRRVSLQRPNGVTTSYAWDQVNRLSRMTHTNAVGVALEDFQYGYDLDDELTSVNSLASATKLPAAKIATAADATNRISQFGAASYSFDADGQTMAKTDGNGVTQYNWDARGRLTSVTLPNGGQVGYGYDALGRRASQTANGLTTSFLYDGSDVALDQPSSGPAVDYLHGAGIDEHLRQGAVGAGQYFLQDHLRSTSALTNASGGVVERQAYEAFGWNADASLSRYGYTGRERDGATGLLYYRARWYDAEQGRFLTEDPAGYQSGTNLYAYIGDDPVNYIDPSGNVGLLATAAIGAAAGAVGGAAWAAATGGSWEDIGRAAASGAVGGAVAGLTLGLGGGVWAGAATGALGNIASQLFEMGVGWRCEFSWGEAAFSGAFGAFGARGARGGGRSRGSRGGRGRGRRDKSFSEEMTPAEAARYDKYWERYAPDQVAPGTTRVDWTRKSGRTGRTEESRVIYDEFGRQKYRVDKTDHMRPSDHSNPHLHEYIYGRQYRPYKEVLNNLDGRK